MALLVNRAINAVQPHARQLLLLRATVLPCATQVAHLTSTRGQPAKRKYPAWPYKKRRYNEFWQFFDNTRKRFDDNSKIILIEGNIAVGKSSFGQKLAQEFDMKFVPDKRDDKLFIRGDNFDVRSLNEQLPARSGFCDMETFYGPSGNPTLKKNFGSTVRDLYHTHFHYYADALEHLLNTGQGVVMERGVYSHMVFHHVLRRMGYFSASALKYLTFMYDNTICEMWRPHLVIYLDAPIEFARSQINKRNIEWEAKSPVITDEFLTTVDKVYKDKYLPYMSKHSDVLTFDLTDLPDWDIIVEEMENLDLDTPPYGNEDKFLDWQSEFENDFNLMRMNVGKRSQIDGLFAMREPFEAPELMTNPEDQAVIKRVVYEHPDVRYAAGYNPEKGSVLLKW